MNDNVFGQPVTISAGEKITFEAKADSLPRGYTNAVVIGDTVIGIIQKGKEGAELTNVSGATLTGKLTSIGAFSGLENVKAGDRVTYRDDGKIEINGKQVEATKGFLTKEGLYEDGGLSTPEGIIKRANGVPISQQPEPTPAPVEPAPKPVEPVPTPAPTPAPTPPPVVETKSETQTFTRTTDIKQKPLDPYVDTTVAKVVKEDGTPVLTPEGKEQFKNQTATFGKSGLGDLIVGQSIPVGDNKNNTVTWNASAGTVEGGAGVNVAGVYSQYHTDKIGKDGVPNGISVRTDIGVGAGYNPTSQTNTRNVTSDNIYINGTLSASEITGVEERNTTNNSLTASAFISPVVLTNEGTNARGPQQTVVKLTPITASIGTNQTFDLTTSAVVEQGLGQKDGEQVRLGAKAQYSFTQEEFKAMAYVVVGGAGTAKQSNIPAGIDQAVLEIKMLQQFGVLEQAGKIDAVKVDTNKDGALSKEEKLAYVLEETKKQVQAAGVTKAPEGGVATTGQGEVTGPGKGTQR